jgi:predicted small secreted protein
MKKRIAVLLILAAVLMLFSGCNQASKVSANISKEADNFNVVRRLTVINARTDKVLFECIGRFSLDNNKTDELTVTVQTGPNEFKKHFVYINKALTMYVVEDLKGANVSPYQYEINFLPEMIKPFTFTQSY